MVTRKEDTPKRLANRKELLIENTKQRTKKNAVRQTEIFRR